MNQAAALIAAAEALVRAAGELKALHERTPLPESPELRERGTRLAERLRAMLEGADRTYRQIHRYCGKVQRSQEARAELVRRAEVSQHNVQDQEIGRCADCMEPLAVGCSLCGRCRKERQFAAAQGGSA